MITNPYQQYQNNSIMTASPGELTLMLYNGAIKFCNLAIEAIENKDMQKGHINLVRVQDIIQELQVTLDMRYEIAQEISKIYDFVKQLLVEANLEKNINKIQDVLYFLREFKEMWQEVIKNKNK